MGQEQPDSGNLKVGETVKTMYVDQSREALQSDRSPSTHILCTVKSCFLGLLRLRQQARLGEESVMW